jgi:hypothetical protein
MSGLSEDRILDAAASASFVDIWSNPVKVYSHRLDDKPLCPEESHGEQGITRGSTIHS